jgi:predicted RecA/RadA family phage recombinase
MTESNFVQDDGVFDYTPAAATTAGKVVLLPSGLLGIVLATLAANQLGAVAIEGVFDVNKDNTSGPVFAAGDAVHWDLVNAQAVHPQAGSYPLGFALSAAGASDASVRVHLQPQRPSVFDGLIREAVDLTSASKTLDIEDCGKRLVVTGSGTYVVTLPSVAAGLRYVIEAASDALRVAISPAAADKIMGADLAGVDNKDRILTAATARKGDYIVVEYGSADGWLVRAERGTWAAEA